MLNGKNVLLGVTGGISAYKAVEIASRLVKLGANVNVIMTKNATKLVQPLTFRYISRNPVAIDMFAEPESWKPEHISLADKADILIIAPATANIIAKLAHGIADDMLSTTALAVRCPILIAPAMNCNMLDNAIVQENIKILKDHKVEFVESEYGMLACGYEGKGRLADPEKIVQKIVNILTIKRDLEGKTILVTAGPTREALDPVRFISNRSSGKMGYAIAEVALKRGANVILITGPTNITPPDKAKVINVESALQMYDAVMSNALQADIIIMSAAVSDYRPKEFSQQKIKRDKGEITLVLEENPDILAELGKNKRGGQIIVGFSMETENLLENSIKKLKKKNADFIVANDLSKEGAGFGTDTNIVTIISADGEVKELPLMSKHDVANAIFDFIIK
ncbi:TPA: bifunctional phosphopantothenoylcysteine decarboxylase/phosphopantothenate--cysteine ligase CoaBC [Candidatus Poribacteria bacterium]|nr:bifunctional phosphopantothenoylcysteine decarboxylase/phosphopantothenate--cysteine ligase CoaBC [Candidatus Poribacteria bacterium]